MGSIWRKEPPKSIRFEAMKSALLEGLDSYISENNSSILFEFRESIKSDLSMFLLGQTKNAYQFSLSVQQGGNAEYISFNFEETVLEVTCGGCTHDQYTGMESYTSWSYSVWSDGSEEGNGVDVESFNVIRELFASESVRFSIDSPDHLCYYSDEECGVEENDAITGKHETYYENHIIQIPTLWDMTPEYHGRVVEITGLLDLASNKEGGCKLYAAHYRRPSITDYVEIELQLQKPIPEYLWNRPRIYKTPVTFRGTLIYDPEDKVYGLMDACYAEYWMNAHGQIECKGLNCEHDCTEGCPVHCNNVANMLMSEGKYREAKTIVSASLEKVPLYADNWIALAECYMNSTEYEEAEEAFYKAYKINKNHPQLLSGLVEVSMRLGRIANAKRYAAMLSKSTGSPLNSPVTDIMGRLMDDEMNRPQIDLPDHVWETLRQESFDAFEALVFEQKLLELMFEESPAPITEIRNKGCYRITSESVASIRAALVEENVPDAENMCIHDLYVAYEKHFIQY